MGRVVGAVFRAWSLGKGELGVKLSGGRGADGPKGGGGPGY
jgi:hypothetical protein